MSGRAADSRALLSVLEEAVHRGSRVLSNGCSTRVHSCVTTSLGRLTCARRRAHTCTCRRSCCGRGGGATLGSKTPTMKRTTGYLPAFFHQHPLPSPLLIHPNRMATPNTPPATMPYKESNDTRQKAVQKRYATTKAAGPPGSGMLPLRATGPLRSGPTRRPTKRPPSGFSFNYWVNLEKDRATRESRHCPKDGCSLVKVLGFGTMKRST
jgi:hypothetical protein